MLIPHSNPGALFAQLAQMEDAEPLPDGGYTVDLYDLDPPVSIEVYPAKSGLDVAAAFTLNYDADMDGYYLGDKLESPESVLAHIGAWLEGMRS